MDSGLSHLLQEAESFNSAGRGRDLDAVPSPHPYPTWRINEMTSTTEPCLNLMKPDLYHV